MAVKRADVRKTMGGTAEPPPPKAVARKLLVEFLLAAGIDPNKTVSLHADPAFITAEHYDGSRTIVQIR